MISQTVDEFFASPEPPRYVTLEEENEGKVERDRYDRPLIKQPDGTKLPYNRASSYGGQIDDKTNVQKWELRQVLRGAAIAVRKGIEPNFLNGIPEHLLDPWDEYTSKREKEAITSMADRAKEYAGSNLKSQLGTDIHYATELVDLGESLEDGLKQFEPWRRELLKERAETYYRVTQDYGLKHHSIEQFGVQDELLVAGTWDRSSFVPWWPGHKETILDVKTSGSMDFAGVTFAVQLATYAHMQAYDIPTGERTPHEDMNLERALIVHVSREKDGPVELFPVNIDEGWKHARLAREIILARREGKKWVWQLDEREARILTATSRAELNEMGAEIVTWPGWLRELANNRWKELE